MKVSRQLGNIPVTETITVNQQRKDYMFWGGDYSTECMDLYNMIKIFENKEKDTTNN